MRERVINFADGRLVGVFAEPAEYARAAVPVVLVPNTGVEHRVGPNRLHVQLCRALADQGFPVLRIDLSGMGDSGMSTAPGNTSTTDLRLVMDDLQKAGHCSRFVVVGLCSGANDAHLLARADSRVIAMASVDGYAYPTAMFTASYWLRRILDPARVLRNVKLRLFPPPIDDVDKAGFAAERVQFFIQPPLQEMTRDLDRLMAREVRLFFMHTGQVQHEYNYTTQLLDAFPRLRRYKLLCLKYKPHADHTFSRAAMRRDLADELIEWLQPLVVATPAAVGDSRPHGVNRV